MTRSEACEILGIPENSSITVAKAAFKILRQEATTEVHGKVLATAFNVFQGVLKGENDDIEIEPVKPAPRPTPRKSSPKPAPNTPTTRKPVQRNLKTKSSEVARQSATGVTEPANDSFQREAALPESAFQNLPELQASRTYQSYETRAFGLLKYATGPTGENWDLSIAPDDRTFLVASASWVYKWDIASGKLVKGATKFGLRWEAHSTSDTYGCDISSDGRLAATANEAGEVFIWNYESGEVLHKLRTRGQPRRVKFALNNTAVVVVGWNGIALLWYFESGHEKPLSFNAPNTSGGDRLSGLDVSKDGKRAYVVGPKLAITAWTLETCERLWTSEILDAHYMFSNLAVSPDESIAVVSQPNGLFWWDLKHRKILQSYNYDNAMFFFPPGPAAAISSDGQFALTPSQNDIILWSLPDKKPLKRLKGHQNRIECIRFSKDGSFAISSGHDQTAKIWRF